MTTNYKQDDLENLLYKDLSAICKQHNIKVQGTKTKLINQILKLNSTSQNDVEPSNKTTKKSKSTSGNTVVTNTSTQVIEPVVVPGTRKRKLDTTTDQEVTPESTTTMESETNMPLQVTNTIESSSTIILESTTGVIPESTTGVIPESSPVIIPESTTGVIPESSSVIIPESTTSTIVPEINSSSTPTTTETIDPDPDNEVIGLRMNRESCNTGELHASLIWHDIADLDIHVDTPDGEHMYFGHKESKSGGWLDKDMNVSVGQFAEEPIENVFWASAPSGKYKIYVHHFRCHTSQDPRFTDPNRSVPFRVRLIKNGKTEWFNGTIAPQQKITCFEFNHQGNGAVGSFVVVPPNDVPATFKELCEKNSITYSQGEGYYALKKKEDISEGKDMVLHNTISDTFVIGHVDVCKALNVATDKKISLSPANIPADHRLFVQSTSHNRKIPASTHVLMKVSVKEALKFRLGSKYKFN